ncbi:MAG: type II toxin-antitoxin system RelE/ParE family toxin [Rhizobiaceae bacterium]|nr:MAG: type II toxin-antitoxin system RelE/ParE family toxin [Rhizobiaceae bacterium]
MRRLRYAPRAESDVNEIIEYTAGVIGDELGALDVGDKLYDQCERLAGLPGTLGRPRSDLGAGLRTFPFGSYVIVFNYVDDDVFEVVRVLHAKRDILALFGGTKP